MPVTNTPPKRGELGVQRELRDVIKDMRGMLGHLGARDRRIVNESIETMIDLAHRLYQASTRHEQTTTRLTLRELAEPELVITKVNDAAENEAHGEEATDATGKP